MKKSAGKNTTFTKVSSNVKVVRPGSRPLTQSNTEKAAIKAKAEQKTPAKRADAKYKQKQTKTDTQRERTLTLNRVYKQALTNAGFKGTGKPTAAQIKAANKARDAKAFALKWDKRFGGGGIGGAFGIKNK